MAAISQVPRPQRTLSLANLLRGVGKPCTPPKSKTGKFALTLPKQTKTVHAASILYPAIACLGTTYIRYASFLSEFPLCGEFVY